MTVTPCPDNEQVTCPEWVLLDLEPDDPPAAIHRHLPPRGWMTYSLHMADGTAYIGHTCRPKDRIKEHAKTGRWRDVIAVAVRLVDTELEARAMEADLHNEPRLVSQLTARDRSRLRELLATATAPAPAVAR